MEREADRAEIDLKLNNEKLSKENKMKLVKERERLNGEIDNLKKIQDKINKKNQKDKAKTRKKMQKNQDLKCMLIR